MPQRLSYSKKFFHNYFSINLSQMQIYHIQIQNFDIYNKKAFTNQKTAISTKKIYKIKC